MYLSKRVELFVGMGFYRLFTGTNEFSLNIWLMIYGVIFALEVAPSFFVV